MEFNSGFKGLNCLRIDTTYIGCAAGHGRTGPTMTDSTATTTLQR